MGATLAPALTLFVVWLWALEEEVNGTAFAFREDVVEVAAMDDCNCVAGTGSSNDEFVWHTSKEPEVRGAGFGEEVETFVQAKISFSDLSRFDGFPVNPGLESTLSGLILLFAIVTGVLGETRDDEVVSVDEDEEDIKLDAEVCKYKWK